jgi:hypothetical protein
MPFMVAFHDAGVLEEARGRSIAGHFPHLRLVSLAPSANVDALPAHLRARAFIERHAPAARSWTSAPSPRRGASS